MTRTKILWTFIDGCLHSVKCYNQYNIILETALDENLEDEPRWRAFRREFNCDTELYSGYNLAKALKHCENDNAKNPRVADSE